MPEYQKQTGTDKSGNPMYGTARFSKQDRQSRKSKTRKKTAGGRNASSVAPLAKEFFSALAIPK